MRRSTDRIRTTHTGSLPRSAAIEPLLARREQGEAVDAQAFEQAARIATEEVVARQVGTGLDCVSDGEQGKGSYVTYGVDRLEGFGSERRKSFPKRRDSMDFPAWAKQSAPRGLATLRAPTCTGPIGWHDFEPVRQDIERLQQATAAHPDAEVFMTAASPGAIANMLPNAYYEDDERYLEALAETMREEYEAIVAAGFILQLDCPDLATGYNSTASHLSIDAFKRIAQRHVDILNGALANIDPQRMRMHVCWGNYEGPHNHDIPLREIAPILLTARPAGLVLEGSNPRHGHEWKVWRDIALPDEKLLVTGCLDTTTNFVEHPELVADRIVQLARVVGRERVIAGTDCGFGTMLGLTGVEAEVAWAKLRALVEGAAIASTRLW